MPSIEFARLLLRLLLLVNRPPLLERISPGHLLAPTHVPPIETASRATPCLSAAGYHHRRPVRRSNLVRFSLDGIGR